MAKTMAIELEPYHIAAIAVTPGFLRSEAMLGDLTEENWRERIKQDKFFAFSETPRYIGRAIAALATDPKIMDKTGQTLATWDLAEEYGFTDLMARSLTGSEVTKPKLAKISSRLNQSKILKKRRSDWLVQLRNYNHGVSLLMPK
jgi:hypothetical protein